MIELFRTSTFRVSALYIGIFGTSVFAVLGFIYYQTVIYSDHQFGETIDAEITGLSEQYNRAGLNGLVDVISERSSAGHAAGMMYLLADGGGHPIAGNLGRWPDARVDRDGWMRFRLDYPATQSAPARTDLVQAESFLLPGGYQLLVGRDLAERDEFRDHIDAALAWSAAMTLGLGLLGGLALSRGVMRRIEMINRTSASIIAGDIGRRVPLTGAHDEFDELAGNLNAMLDRIGRLMEGMRQVTDNVAHDLRSPLGRLRSRIEVALLEEKPTLERYRGELERTIDEADQLLGTFTALLDIAELEAGNLSSETAPLDLAELVRDIAELYEPAAEEVGLHLAATLSRQHIMVAGNRHLLSRALANLIENALKYVPAGSSIGIDLTQIGSRVRLIVADSGPGIPETQRDLVFNRFYRMEWSRTTPGNGLGLSLVRAVIRMHQGTIALTDTIPGAINPGLSVIVELPALPAA